MTGESQSEETPRSPEAQPDYVKKELDQEDMSHVGEYRDASNAQRGTMQGLGAVDTEVVPVTPPMAGPADLVGERNQDAQGNETGTTRIGEELIDPRDEITPG